MLDLQQNIEEKRLILGKKLEDFLLKKLKNIADFFCRIFATKSCAFFGVLFVVLISIFVRSTRDIGYSSGFALDFLSINQILLAEILVNIVGILSIYFSFLILKKSEISKNKIVLNLLIISFSTGFFLRVFTLQFNDFITFYSIVLAVLYPLISLIIKSSKNIFYWFVFISITSASFYFGSDFYAKKSLLISLFLPLIVLLAYYIQAKKYINWKRDFVILIFIVTALQFDPRIFGQIVFNIGAFWWLFVIIFSLSRMDKRLIFLGKNPNNLDSINFLSKFLLPQNLVSWLCFIGLAILTVVLISNKNTKEFAWFFSITIFVLLVFFYQKLHEKSLGKKEFSTFSASMIFLIFSYFINLHLAAIFNFNYASKYKSPNQVSEQIFSLLNSYKIGEMTIISDEKRDVYPAANYSQRINTSSFLLLQKLYKNSDGQQEIEFLLKDLGQKIADNKNKIIIIKQNSDNEKQCFVGFLEYYFDDKNFRKNFLSNYVYLTKIVEKEEEEKSVDFFSDDKKNIQELMPNLGEKVIREFEVYVKK